MREAGKYLLEAMDFIEPFAKSGESGKQLDSRVLKKIQSMGCETAFLGFQGFSGTLIYCRNDEAVHAPPNNDLPKEGDLITLDLGLRLKGYYVDKAVSFVLGGSEKNERAQKLIDVTVEAFWAGVDQIKPGNIVNDISLAIGNIADKYGVKSIRTTTGHGIGKDLHEDPIIFNFPNPRSNIKLKPGMVFCVEPVFAETTEHVTEGEDGWTLSTRDGSLSAHYENTIVVTKNGYEILSL